MIRWRWTWIALALTCASTASVVHVLGADERPNILLLLTDDQDLILGGTDQMPNLQKYLADEGTFFSNAFVHTPICCPSRASILTGKYIHNIPVVNNSLSGNCYGDEWIGAAEHQTFATVAAQAGYLTSYAGKYLNRYGKWMHKGGAAQIPPGWDRWFGLVGNSRYYNYTMVRSDHGAPPTTIRHGDDPAADYLPDLLLNRTMEVLRSHHSSTAGHPHTRRPFLHVLAWPTPHGPFTPAPQYADVFAGQTAHRTPNYNAPWTANQQKHWLVRQMAEIDGATEELIDGCYRSRLEALLSVDDHVQTIVEYLASVGTLENTVIVYTSDNGFQLGQHRIKGDKRQPYEHDIRVPFIVRGPGFAKGVTTDEIVLNVDLAPSIVELVTKGYQGEIQDIAADGASFVPPTAKQRKEFLVSYHGEGIGPCGWGKGCPRQPGPVHGADAWNNTYHCLRTLSRSENSMYCEFDDDEDFVEYYDLTTDPWQLRNAHGQLGPCRKGHYARRLAGLRTCRGASCHQEVALDDPVVLCQ